MRQIEKKMLAAFKVNKNFKESNTEVLNLAALNGQIWVRLFGNIIAKKDIKTGLTVYSLAGWDTLTTRSRLSALGCNCQRIKGVTMRNGRPWKGDF